MSARSCMTLLFLEIFFFLIKQGYSFNSNDPSLLLYVTCNGEISNFNQNIKITTYGSNTLTFDRFNMANRACYFTGSQYFKGDSTLFSATDRTVTMWFKTATTSPVVLFSYGGSATCLNFLITMNSKKVNTPPSIETHNNCTLTSQPIISYSKSTFNLINQWSFVAVTTDSSGMRLYLNSTLVASTYFTLKPTFQKYKEFSVGVATSYSTGTAPYADANFGYFTGALDEIKYYSRSLGSMEIIDIFNQEKNRPPKCNNPTVALNFTYPSSINITLGIYFSDEDGDILTYAIKMKNSLLAFPTWLNFKNSNGQIVNLLQPVIGVYVFIVNALDKYATSSNLEFTLTINQLSCQIGYVVSSNYVCESCKKYHIACVECTDTAKGTCKKCDNSGYYLSNGVCYNCMDTFCSNCEGSGTNKCVFCNSGYKLNNYKTCIQDVNNKSPILKKTSETVVLNMNSNLYYSSVGNFEDPDGNTLTYSISMKDKSPIPTWLSFSEPLGEVSNNSLIPLGMYNFIIYAKDQSSSSPGFELIINIVDSTNGNCGSGTYQSASGQCSDCEDEFCDVCYGIGKNNCKICKEGYNITSNNQCISTYAPRLVKTNDQVVFTENDFINYSCNSTFVSLNGNSLTYNILMKDSTSIPSWVNFSNTTGIIKANSLPPIGFYRFIITAKDSITQFKSDSFELIITITKSPCNPGFTLIKDSCKYCADYHSNGCLECIGISQGQCTKCNSGSYLLNGKCNYCEDKFCLTCSGVNKCTSCTNNYVLTGNRCQPKQNCMIPYCSECITPNKCKTCSVGYSLSSDGTQCKPKLSCLIPNCVVCTTPDQCKTCSVGFSNDIDGNQCTACDDSNCINCYYSHSVCEECVSSFKLFDGNCVKYCSDSSCSTCNNDITKSAYISSNKKCARKCNSIGCSSCTYPTICDTCASQYKIYEGSCYNPQCVEKECLICSDKNVCLKCVDNFKISDGVCVSDESHPYIMLIIVSLISCTFIYISIYCYRRYKKQNLLAQARAVVHSNRINLRANQAVNPNIPESILDSHRVPNQLELENVIVKIKTKCLFCESEQLFGITECGCLICSEHCNQINKSIVSKINLNLNCKVHQIKINNYTNLRELNDNNKIDLPNEDELNSSIQGKCTICFENLASHSFFCGCPSRVCEKCYDSHVKAFKFETCPFCRGKINSANRI